jgi:hypothetical protein
MEAEGGLNLRRSHRIEEKLGSILLRVRGIIAKPGVSIEEKERSIGVALEAVRRINPAIAEEARVQIAPLVEILRQRQQRAPARKSKKRSEIQKVSQKKKVTGAAGAMARYKKGLGTTLRGSHPRYAPIFSPDSASLAAAAAPGFAAAAPGFVASAPGFSAASPGFSAASPGFAAASPGFAAASPGFAFPPPPRHPRQSNILSSELDDLTRLLQGASLDPSESVMAGAPPPPPPAAALVLPPSPPYSPSPDPLLAQFDSLMLELANRLRVTEEPNYAPPSPKGGKRNTLSRRQLRRSRRRSRSRRN